jgi:hypothetical protein
MTVIPSRSTGGANTVEADIRPPTRSASEATSSSAGRGGTVGASDGAVSLVGTFVDMVLLAGAVWRLTSGSQI